ncbi:relaxase/mobilization nuclease domain-containing protein [Pedobacter sp. GR22-10]|uniref:relaxase/mobilization nuclease domain-containing protein n=1 Tax=Pedobacter sp. GR22-10 TaxID=2994472 RepID=UPI0022483DC3|nr:relaxase/mobilization nuclease domain-containing protein [Pedobacter sp. GR22-10]MCX2429860.1 relaxase/mobilization nuclease domain-containing protein [Pedobacter sp. GR22-10]
MVSVIHLGSSFRQVLNYNENKVKEGVATCFEAAYYLKEADKLSFNQKLGRLQQQASKRESVKVNCVHISLNFDPSEHHSQDRLKEITAAYLDKIGFAGQPYLLYEHRDAGHPHVHIVTTNIRNDGTPISLHNLGKIHSERARKEIEIEFSLVKAEDSPKRKANDIEPVNIRAEYGKSETKRAITRVLNSVLKAYKFSSLPELNAVLQLYNVIADQGSTESRVYKNGGLTYRILDKDGSLLGVPIKASDFYNKPTLKNLAPIFIANDKAKQSGEKSLRTAIDLALLSPKTTSLNRLIQVLEQGGVDTVIMKTKEGTVYGLTYVDHNSKTVFKGSDLGKAYGTKGIIDRLEPADVPSGQEKIILPNPLHHTLEQGGTAAHSSSLPPQFSGPNSAPDNFIAGQLLEELAQHDSTSGSTPYELSGKKKRRKKRRSINNSNP